MPRPSAPRLLPVLAALAAFAGAAGGLGCTGPEDTPSNVKDLRVLGIQVDPPELLAPICAFSTEALKDPAVQQALAVWSAPVDYTALIEDPAGGGREISWELRACAAGWDRTCTAEGDPHYLIASGKTLPGELKVPGIKPGLLGVNLAQGDFQNALLFRVLQDDTYRGLGGIRVPLVLHVKAGDEEIYAQKLMVYWCNFFPQPPGGEGPTMEQNVNPVLPGVTLEGTEWKDGEVRPLSGKGPFAVEAQDFKDREEHYVVPSFQLQPVELDESWKVAWHADLGHFSPNQSGGSDLDGVEERVRSEWTPGSSAHEQDVTFWFVVRDGRGGESWITRRAHYTP